MTKTNQMIFILIMCSIFTACVNKNSYKKLVNTEGKTQKILVVSSVGDDFIAKFIGFTIFTNKERTLDVSSWDLDTEIEEKIVKFPVNEGFSLSTLDFKGVKSNYPKLSYDNFFSKVSFHGLDEEIFPLASQHGYDLIMFVLTNTSDDNVFYTGVPLNGYGLYKRSMQSSSAIYSSNLISMYDVKTRKKVLNLPAAATSQKNNSYRNKKIKHIAFDDIKDEKNTIVNLVLEGVKERMRFVKIVPE